MSDSQIDNGSRSTTCRCRAGAGCQAGAVTVPLIGRDQELEALDSLVGPRELVTVTGPGGVGKTRLVSEWAWRHADLVAGGARMVSLTGDADGEATPGRAASRLGFRSFDAFRLSVSATPTVVVLDNCESAPAAARTMAEALTRPGSEARVVVTSREALRAAGEHVLVLEPLAVPPAGHLGGEDSAPAVELFVRLALGRRGGLGARPRDARRRGRAGAGCSTGCRSPSSWPPPGCGR